VDSKGRVTCPREFRKVLEDEKYNGVLTFNSYHLEAIEAFGMSRMEKLNDKLYQSNNYPFFDKSDESINSIFADICMLPFDKDGRIVLTDAIKKHAQIENVAVFVGRGSTFQIWNPVLFANYQQNEREKIRNKIING
jgi:MraZ protein